MLVSIPNDDHVIVHNKGVEITLVTDKAMLDKVMEACRILGVMGISCAVIEITGNSIENTKVIPFYEKVAKAMICTNESLKELVMPFLKQETHISIMTDKTAKELVSKVKAFASELKQSSSENDVARMKRAKESIVT